MIAVRIVAMLAFFGTLVFVNHKNDVWLREAVKHKGWWAKLKFHFAPESFEYLQWHMLGMVVMGISIAAFVWAGGASFSWAELVVPLWRAAK